MDRRNPFPKDTDYCKEEISPPTPSKGNNIIKKLNKRSLSNDDEDLMNLRTPKKKKGRKITIKLDILLKTIVG